MTIEFSHHAMEKARRRGVSMAQIYQTLRTPDELYDDIEYGTVMALKKINDKSVVLAYREEAGAVKVITIYYTTKIDRLVASKTVRGAWKKVK